MNEVEIFKLLSDDHRLKIFILLLHKELCICDFEKRLNMKQANVSKHMKFFKELDVVETRKDAQWVYYKINQAFVEKHQDLVSYIEKLLISNEQYKLLIQCEQISCK